MFRPSRSALIATAAALALSAPVLSAQEVADLTTDLEAEISRLDEEIAEARNSQSEYSGGALSIIAALNTQTLELTQSVLEARLAAEETGAPVEITVPAVEPDPELAEEIAAEIEAQQGLVDAARAEAQSAGGLMAALAMTRYETERLTLAQLRQAWLRARYGIAFPMTTAPAAPAPEVADAQTADTPNEGEADDAPNPNAGLAWADPDHPDIDYSAAIFSQLANDDYEIAGWWGIERSSAAIDDSPQVFAINVSDWGGDWAVNHPSLMAACIEGQARVLFDTDDFIMTGYQVYTIPVTVRIDDAEATQMSWGALTTNDGAGLFGPDAEDFIRDLQDADRVFLRLRENDGETHDLEIELAGVETAFGAIAGACQFSLIELTQEDYKAVQTLLNAGGFEAGTPDGIWGSGSRAAMSAYQEANGLDQTGIPDEATLAAMGINISG